jgi:hypothetical protein
MTLFDKLLTATGLSPVFARASITRALARVSAKPDTLSVDQIKTALPELEKVLRVFLQADELPKRLADIQRLTR